MLFYQVVTLSRSSAGVPVPLPRAYSLLFRSIFHAVKTFYGVSWLEQEADLSQSIVFVDTGKVRRIRGLLLDNRDLGTSVGCCPSSADAGADILRKIDGMVLGSPVTPRPSPPFPPRSTESRDCSGYTAEWTEVEARS